MPIWLHLIVTLWVVDLSLRVAFFIWRRWSIRRRARSAGREMVAAINRVLVDLASSSSTGRPLPSPPRSDESGEGRPG
jgi:hypothetical protein